MNEIIISLDTMQHYTGIPGVLSYVVYKRKKKSHKEGSLWKHNGKEWVMMHESWLLGLFVPQASQGLG